MQGGSEEDEPFSVATPQGSHVRPVSARWTGHEDSRQEVTTGH